MGPALPSYPPFTPPPPPTAAPPRGAAAAGSADVGHWREESGPERIAPQEPGGPGTAWAAAYPGAEALVPAGAPEPAGDTRSVTGPAYGVMPPAEAPYEPAGPFPYGPADPFPRDPAGSPAPGGPVDPFPNDPAGRLPWEPGRPLPQEPGTEPRSGVGDRFTAREPRTFVLPPERAAGPRSAAPFDALTPGEQAAFEAALGPDPLMEPPSAAVPAEFSAPSVEVALRQSAVRPDRRPPLEPVPPAGRPEYPPPREAAPRLGGHPGNGTAGSGLPYPDGAPDAGRAATARPAAPAAGAGTAPDPVAGTDPTASRYEETASAGTRGTPGFAPLTADLGAAGGTAPPDGPRDGATATTPPTPAPVPSGAQEGAGDGGSGPSAGGYATGGGFEAGGGYEAAAPRTAVHEPDARRAGADESGTYEGGAQEPGTYRPGADESGAHQGRTGEPDAYESGPHEPGAYGSDADSPAVHESGAHQSRPDEGGAREPWAYETDAHRAAGNAADDAAAPVPGSGAAGGTDDAARAVADFVGLADSGDVDEMSDERIRTIIWTAATYRPLEEVAALVTMLKRTGAVSNPGDEALRAAAVARPLEEVRQLVAMLNEAGHPIDESDTTLRAAAVGRPIEDVVQLVSILGTAKGGGAAAGKPVVDPVGPGAAPAPEPAAAVPPAPPTEPVAATAAKPAAAASAPSVHVPENPNVRPPRSVTASAAPAEPKVLVPEEPADRAGRAGHSALRWPAAAALLACGLIHLPVDLAGVRSGGGGMVSLAVTALCMVTAVVLVMRESARAWMASAVTAVGVFLVHTVAGADTFALLERSVGAAFAWSGTAALVASVLVVLMAGRVLLRQRREPDPAEEA
ncbi:hypothetical protein [Streptomyces sp. NPDC046887]|uniref:hypothetical protein n=1 Tax=Streptomyces sp. NPDC046887 TaxID=3155472 RepID=UPI0033DCD768